MKAVIEGSFKVSCKLVDLWRCLGNRQISDCHLVLVTFADGSQRMLTGPQLTSDALIFDENSNKKLSAWQLLMLPTGDGRETERGMLGLVHERDILVEKLESTPARHKDRAKVTRAAIADIEARLESLPATVFRDFREVAATRARVAKLEAKLENYQARSNWSPIDDSNTKWMWAGADIDCKTIDEPWRFAEEGLAE